MKRHLVLVGVFCVLASLAGCGSESGDAPVNQAIVVMNNARARLAAVKNEVDKAVSKAASENNRDLTGDDFKAASTQASQLKEVGGEMQRVRERTDAVKDSISPEEREELTKRFKSRWEQESIELQKTQNELDLAIKKAEDRGPKTAVEELKKTLRLGLSDFEVIARQQ